jgi:hypothetical protein
VAQRSAVVAAVMTDWTLTSAMREMLIEELGDRHLIDPA